ncbi:hypothetical protein R1sor_022572 [Riccia sorocarpa]|uniref:Uncharacterized protein n=1 Tax=Riccia sorocarpa TaxID=122646 RepID=A0ABD3GP31_9MARC
MASTSAEVKRLSPGENILLYGDNFIVVVGSVHLVDESELCHGEIIGRGRISVQICSSLWLDFILPYPSPGANTVGEAVNSFAIWDISKVYPMPELPQSQYQAPPEPTPNASTQVHADEHQSTSRGRESTVRPEDQLFFKVRKNWANVEVTLLMSSRCRLRMELYFCPSAPPVLERGAQIGDEDMPVKKKRAYNSAKRTKPNPEVLLQRRLNQKKMSMCTLDKISECLRFTCTCSRECMRKVDKKDIIDERSFFYNEPVS